jgi:hypothetical protein
MKGAQKSPIIWMHGRRKMIQTRYNDIVSYTGACDLERY